MELALQAQKYKSAHESLAVSAFQKQSVITENSHTPALSVCHQTSNYEAFFLLFTGDRRVAAQQQRRHVRQCLVAELGGEQPADGRGEPPARIGFVGRRRCQRLELPAAAAASRPGGPVGGSAAPDARLPGWTESPGDPGPGVDPATTAAEPAAAATAVRDVPAGQPGRGRTAACPGPVFPPESGVDYYDLEKKPIRTRDFYFFHSGRKKKVPRKYRASFPYKVHRAQCPLCPSASVREYYYLRSLAHLAFATRSPRALIQSFSPKNRKNFPFFAYFFFFLSPPSCIRSFFFFFIVKTT